MPFCPPSSHQQKPMDKESKRGSGKGGEVSDAAESVARSVEIARFLSLIHSKYGKREDFRRENGPRARNKALIISVVLRPCLCGESTRGGAAAGTLVPMAAASLWEPSLLPYTRPRPVLREHECKCGPSSYLCSCVRHTCHGTHAEVRHQQEPILRYLCVGPGDQSQVFGLDTVPLPAEPSRQPQCHFSLWHCECDFLKLGLCGRSAHCCPVLSCPLDLGTPQPSHWTEGQLCSPQNFLVVELVRGQSEAVTT